MKKRCYGESSKCFEESYLVYSSLDVLSIENIFHVINLLKRVQVRLLFDIITCKGFKRLRLDYFVKGDCWTEIFQFERRLIKFEKTQYETAEHVARNIKRQLVYLVSLLITIFNKRLLK